MLYNKSPRTVWLQQPPLFSSLFCGSAASLAFTEDFTHRNQGVGWAGLAYGGCEGKPTPSLSVVLAESRPCSEHMILVPGLRLPLPLAAKEKPLLSKGSSL